MTNPDLQRLQPYPFERLAALTRDIVLPSDRRTLSLSIGEPRHEPPRLVLDAMADGLEGLAYYPASRGTPALRAAIRDWLQQRYSNLSVDPDTQILPVLGTREALFGVAQIVVDRHAPTPTVVLPNPFYQIYEGAALLAGAQPWYYPAGDPSGPDFASIPTEIWDRCQLLYICSPGNPTGAVIEPTTLGWLIALAQHHDFVIAADECYAEIYPDTGRPPTGLLEAATAAGYPGFDRCLVFHSLSKRSNLPGLRSGFVAGDADLIAAFAQYRTYQGCAMPPPSQAASIAAWGDESHVRANRAAYREKFEAVLAELGDTLDVEQPAAGFYLWPRTPIDDEAFARGLLSQEGVRVLPGRYLGREHAGQNPGRERIRIALVPALDDCIEAARRIRRYTETIET